MLDSEYNENRGKCPHFSMRWYEHVDIEFEKLVSENSSSECSSGATIVIWFEQVLLGNVTGFVLQVEF